MCHRPDLVQVEYMELGGLVKDRTSGRPWILTLHDVLLSENKSAQNEADRYEKQLMEGFSAVVACSEEDALLLGRENVHLIPNGIDLEYDSNANSQGRHGLLFMGPFRYEPNLRGILEFVEKVYPILLREFPNLELVILGGRGAQEFSRGRACLRQRNIRILDYVEDTRSWLAWCAATLNPQCNIRGSSIKVLESLAAGRVCVSTTEGARGYHRAGFPGLITVERIEEFADPLSRILRDEDYRLSLESPPYEQLLPYTWEHSAQRLSDLYHGVMNQAQPTR
jgi:glycosyltransferase involved in cell wall biosynthesis